MSLERRKVVEAEPEPLEIDLQRTAVMVVDMQNAFVSKGGMFDLWGRDVSKLQKPIEPIKKINSVAPEHFAQLIVIDSEDEVHPGALRYYKETGLWRAWEEFKGE